MAKKGAKEKQKRSDEMLVHVIRLDAFAPLHPGRERWKRVTKQSWAFIPGATLFGALAQALMRIDCHKESAAISIEECSACLSATDPPCDYARILQATMKEEAKQKIRFSPLVASTARDGASYDALSYSRDAMACLTARSAVLPRAPISRRSGTIFEDRLHGVEAHSPISTYRGFVFAAEALAASLRRGLRALPFFPFAGARGKLSFVQARIEASLLPNHFCNPVLTACKDMQLLTPAIIDESHIRQNTIEAFTGFRLQRYRFWRTGWYYENGELRAYGVPDENRDHPSMTNARVGIVQGTQLHLAKEIGAELFIKGLGDRDFTYLGWGQPFFLEV